jgi:hypothetical protein
MEIALKDLTIDSAGVSEMRTLQADFPDVELACWSISRSHFEPLVYDLEAFLYEYAAP